MLKDLVKKDSASESAAVTLTRALVESSYCRRTYCKKKYLFLHVYSKHSLYSKFIGT